MTFHMSPTSAYPTRPPPHPLLPDELRLGPVHLTVTDLERSIGFYERAVGVPLGARASSTAELGAGAEPVLVLHEQPEASRPGRHAGLYHVALLFPGRLELARVGMRLQEAGVAIQGAADHGTHEAFYLPDPDGNGLELAADRARDDWIPYDLDGRGPQPLDVADLMSLAAGEPAPELVEGELRVGHLHLHVGDLEEARRFYVDVVGFEEQFAFESAIFVSAGGYHHHLGMNVWRGRGVPPAPDDAIGLRRWTVVLPGAGDVDRLRGRFEAAGVEVERDEAGGLLVRDPWRHVMHVVVER